MSDQLQRLAQRIQDELVELEQVVERATLGWERATRSADDLYLDSVALNLHGFYDGIERLFAAIAITIDDTPPQGSNWHQLLLTAMKAEKPGLRPAVISEETRSALDAYRGFRHMVRHAYAFRFQRAKMEPLALNLAATFNRVRSELTAFASFLLQADESA